MSGKEMQIILMYYYKIWNIIYYLFYKSLLHATACTADTIEQDEGRNFYEYD